MPRVYAKTHANPSSSSSSEEDKCPIMIEDTSGSMHDVRVLKRKHRSKRKHKHVEFDKPEDNKANYYKQNNNVLSVFVRQPEELLIYLDLGLHIAYTALYGTTIEDLRMSYFKYEDMVSDESIPESHAVMCLAPISECIDNTLNRVIKVPVAAGDFDVTIYASRESLFITVIKVNDKVNWKDICYEQFHVLDKQKI